MILAVFRRRFGSDAGIDVSKVNSTAGFAPVWTDNMDSSFFCGFSEKIDQADAWGLSSAMRLNMADTSSTLSLMPSISSFASLEAMSLMALCCMVCW